MFFCSTGFNTLVRERECRVQKIEGRRKERVGVHLYMASHVATKTS
jgi:hypothetical protein